MDGVGMRSSAPLTAIQVHSSSSQPSPSQLVLQTVTEGPEPAVTSCCGGCCSCCCSITRTIEGLAWTICIIAIGALFYFVFGGADVETLTYVADGALILMSGGCGYYAHQAEELYALQNQIRRLTSQVNRLSQEVDRLKPENDRYQALNVRFEALLTNLSTVATGIQATNEALRLTSGDFQQTEDALEKVARVFQALQGKLEVYLGGLAKQIQELDLIRKNLELGITQIAKTGDVQKGISKLEGDLVEQQRQLGLRLEEVTRKQEDLTRREQSLVAHAEQLGGRFDVITQRQEDLTNREEKLVAHAEVALTPATKKTTTAVSKALSSSSSSSSSSAAPVITFTAESIDSGNLEPVDLGANT